MVYCGNFFSWMMQKITMGFIIDIILDYITMTFTIKIAWHYRYNWKTFFFSPSPYPLSLASLIVLYFSEVKPIRLGSMFQTITIYIFLIYSIVLCVIVLYASISSFFKFTIILLNQSMLIYIEILILSPLLYSIVWIDSS